MNATTATPQGFGPDRSERIGLAPREVLSEAQRAAADAIIAGPRKALFGPFVPLLQTPALMDRIGRLGEALRYEGALPDRVRELSICAVARHTSNQFEWQTHRPLAEKAGVASAALDALAAGRDTPAGLLTEDENEALAVVHELLRQHGASDATYAAAVARFGAPGVVEIVSLAGYFAMVCWVMNVARTPGPAGSSVAPLQALPA